MTPMQSFEDPTFYPRGENRYFGTGWEGSEQLNNQYDPRGRDLSWDYSDANVSYEGSYLIAIVDQMGM